jgi:kanamycin kinase
VSIAGPPPGDVAVPDAVRRAAAGADLVPVWLNELGGLTFQLGSGPGRRFVKWAPVGSGLSLDAEVDRLRWAAPYTTVPRVIDQGHDPDGEWMVLAGLPGDNAVTPAWKARPAVAVAAVARALRAFHDRLPVETCPFTWSVADRLAEAGIPPADPPAPLADPPAVDRLVVCHGDPCVPNTLLAPDGTWTGHVDLGALGTADRWADIAVGSWSTEWNYGSGWEPLFLDAYGIEADHRRIAFYRNLWNIDDHLPPGRR